MNKATITIVLVSSAIPAVFMVNGCTKLEAVYDPRNEVIKVQYGRYWQSTAAEIRIDDPATSKTLTIKFDSKVDEKAHEASEKAAQAADIAAGLARKAAGIK